MYFRNKCWTVYHKIYTTEIIRAQVYSNIAYTLFPGLRKRIYCLQHFPWDNVGPFPLPTSTSAKSTFSNPNKLIQVENSWSNLWFPRIFLELTRHLTKPVSWLLEEWVLIVKRPFTDNISTRIWNPKNIKVKNVKYSTGFFVKISLILFIPISYP